MLPSVTYERYAELGGMCEEEAFSASLPHAVAAVREVIGFNVPECDSQTEAYERAVCAAVDVDYSYGASGGVGEGLASITVGSFTASMGQNSTSGSNPYLSDIRRAIKRELTGSGLLYQGIG